MSSRSISTRGAKRGERRPGTNCGWLYVRADVTSEIDVTAAFEAAFLAYGSVDVAFNNAGISPPDDDSILDTSLDAWRRVQDVNLTSVYLCCRTALRYMQRQGKGAIVNTASFVAVMGSATSQISYTASKGGVLALSRELGVQFAREGGGARAHHAICPGPVSTPPLQELFAADRHRRRRSRPPPPGAHPSRQVRGGGGDRGRGRVPGQRRRLVHHRVHVPGRRRHLRRLRHPPVDPPSPRRRPGRHASPAATHR